MSNQQSNNKTVQRIKQIVKNSAGGLTQQLLRVPAGGKVVQVTQADGRTALLRATAASRSLAN